MAFLARLLLVVKGLRPAAVFDGDSCPFHKSLTSEYRRIPTPVDPNNGRKQHDPGELVPAAVVRDLIDKKEPAACGFLSQSVRYNSRIDSSEGRSIQRRTVEADVGIEKPMESLRAARQFDQIALQRLGEGVEQAPDVARLERIRLARHV